MTGQCAAHTPCGDAQPSVAVPPAPAGGGRFVSAGYEGLTVEELVGELTRRGVGVLADVRLNAVSRRPGFSKRVLARTLAAAGIEYRHLRALGNPRENRAAFQRTDPTGGHQVFQARMATAAAQAQLDELVRMARQTVVAVLCVERDETLCHRRLVLDACRARVE